MDMMEPSSSSADDRFASAVRAAAAWTPDEDAALERLAMENGSRHWSRVATQMPRRRSRRECRDRWRDHLARDVFHRPFAAADDDKLTRLCMRPGGGGPRWKDIIKAVYGRSTRAVRRRWMEIRTSEELLKKLWHPASSMLSQAGQDAVMDAVVD